jgi:DNA-binding CsgD family transcriptional regulator
MGDRTWHHHAAFAAVASAGITGLWALTRDPVRVPGDDGAGYWWPLWTALAWGLLVGLHYLRDTGRLGRRDWRAHAVYAAVANAGIVGLWALTRDRTPAPGDQGAGYWWPLWTALVWGLLVGLHRLYATGRLWTPAPSSSLAPASSPSPGPGLSPSLSPDPQAGALGTLTRREREILALVAQGHPNRAIAERLFISERTTRTHVSNILRKLELPSRTQAALLAVEAGLRGHDVPK